MINLNKEVQFIKGVGPNRVALLKKLGIETLGDLISFFPREHEDRSKPKNIADLIDGEEALISCYPIGRMNEIHIRKNMTICKLFVRDETGGLEIDWYNQTYLKNNFTVNKRYSFYGKVSIKGGKITMQSPIYELDGANKNTGKIVPIYPLTYSLSQNTIRKIMENGINEVYGYLEETLPNYLITKYKLYDINNAIKQIHFPDDFQKFNQARRRLVFEELFTMQLALLKLKNKYDINKQGICFNENVKMSDVINDLPYKLTSAQLRVLEEIDKDMESNKPMNRLLQGDVGSRKNCCCYGSLL
jgi:ATP-dependent DNA helicase RecG